LSDKFDTGFLIVLFIISLQAWLIKVKGLQERLFDLVNLSYFENNSMKSFIIYNHQQHNL